MGRLARLLRPKSIAIIGGGTWGANVAEASRAMGFDGDIWPVHPSKAEIAGFPAYPSVDALPAAPDAAFVGVNRRATIDVIKGLRLAGAGGATCFASGFAEAETEMGGSADLQAALLAAAGEMPILGPNCYGLLNYLDKVAIWPDQHGGLPVDRGVAIVTQSSNIAINLTMQTRGLPIAYVVTAGNQAQTDIAEIAMECLADERVTALGLHIEGVKDINVLCDLSDLSHELKKPVVVIKMGASEAAQAATLSHTASLAGNAAGASALLARLGFSEAPSLPVFLELLKLWHVAGPLPHKRIASASCSGGEACLVADTSEPLGLEFPPLTPEQSAPLRQALGPKVALANPLDYHTYIWPDPVAMSATFTALMQADLALGLIILDFPRGDRCDASDWQPVIEAVAMAQAASGRPMAIVSALSETLPEEVCAQLMAKNIVPLCGLDHALQAIDLAVLPARSPERPALPRAARGGSVLVEDMAKAALAKAGLRVPAGQVCATPDDIARAARGLTAPFVVKGMGLAHKSEAGAVKLGLTSEAAAQNAAEHMASDRFLIEEMVQGALFEMLIGVTRDAAHGYLLTLGAGGTRTEILDDVEHLLLPVTRSEVHAALNRLKHAPILAGYRGTPPCDLEAIWQAVDAVQRYVLAPGRAVTEVEINPLICTQTSAIAVDALVHEGDPA